MFGHGGLSRSKDKRPTLGAQVRDKFPWGTNFQNPCTTAPITHRRRPHAASSQAHVLHCSKDTTHWKTKIWTLPWTSPNFTHFMTMRTWPEKWNTSCNITKTQSQPRGTSCFCQYKELFPKTFINHRGFCRLSCFSDNGPKPLVKRENIVGVYKFLALSKNPLSKI